jgi:hypothetical protein
MRAVLLGVLAAALLTEGADAQQAEPPSWLPGAQVRPAGPAVPDSSSANPAAQPQYPSSANLYLPPCQKLIQRERDTRSAFGRGVCQGTVYGLLYASDSCLPTGVSLLQVVRVVVAYIERRPQRMHEDFRKLSVEALHEAWPCK